MNTEIKREFIYSFSITKTVGAISTFCERGIESINDAILAREHYADGNGEYHIIVEYGEVGKISKIIFDNK